MVIDIPHLVRELIPLTRSIEGMSVACVHTTRPKYLVFAADPQRPAFVVQFGPGAQMARTHHALLRLHARLPDVVAESLVCAEINGGDCVHIQTGLAGLPWFRVADICASRADWMALLERSLTVLMRLHVAVADSPEWTCDVNPGHELRERLQATREPGLRAGAEPIARWLSALDRLGPVRGAWQHGDFSVNNLLIADSEIGVIDFDEFGDTSMPLHDEMGLALSFPLSQHGLCPLSIKECLHRCLAPALARGRVAADAVPGLFLHHLLWRIERCEDYPARAGLRATLRRYLHRLLDQPEELLGEADLRRAIMAV